MTELARVRRLAFFQTLGVMSAVSATVLVAAIVTRIQSSSDDTIPADMLQKMREQANSAALQGMRTLKIERAAPNVDRTQRAMVLTSSVATLEGIRSVVGDHRFDRLLRSTKLAGVLETLQKALQRWKMQGL